MAADRATSPTVPTTARIHQRETNASQTGRARGGEWVLEILGGEPLRHDPLTGWLGSRDTATQVALTFPTREAAEAYAARAGLAIEVVEPPAHRIKIQAYSDNFR